MKHALFLFLLTGASVFASYDLSRYEVIMERAPFGKEPPPSETAETARQAGAFAKQYRLCMLYKNGQGELKAGVVSKVSNKNFFLQVGESEEGLSLVEVRLEEGVAVVRQGGETAQLMLEGLGSLPVALSSGSSPAVASTMPENTAIRQIRRSGSDIGAAHIRAALTDSAPKQARITVRKTDPVPSPEDAAADSSGSGRGTSVELASTPASAPVPSGANYLVQSVPKRYSPF